MKLTRILLLIVAVTSLSSCWWDSDRDERVDVPNLVYYAWETTFPDTAPGDYSVFIFKDNGFGVEQLWHDGNRKPYDYRDFSWRENMRGRYNFIELDYGRNADFEFLYDVRIDGRRRIMYARHFLNPRDFEYFENGADLTFYSSK